MTHDEALSLQEKICAVVAIVCALGAGVAVGYSAVDFIRFLLGTP